MKINNHYWLLALVLLAVAIIPNASALNEFDYMNFTLCSYTPTALNYSGNASWATGGAAAYDGNWSSVADTEGILNIYTNYTYNSFWEEYHNISIDPTYNFRFYANDVGGCADTYMKVYAYNYTLGNYSQIGSSKYCETGGTAGATNKTIYLNLNSFGINTSNKNNVSIYTYIDGSGGGGGIGLYEGELQWTPLFVPTLNFTTKYESNGTILTGTDFDASFNITPNGNLSYNKLYTFSIDNDADGKFDLCVFPSNIQIYIDSFIEYSKTSFDTRNYIISNGTITNSTNSIDLFLIESASTTDLVIKVLDANLLAQQGLLVQMQRYYPSTAQWKTVQIAQSDVNGQALFNVVTGSVDYRFIVYNTAGAVLYNSGSMKIVCYDTPCVVNLVIPSTTQNIFQYYQGIAGLNYNISFNNNTNVVTFIYIDTTGLTKQMRLNVQKTNISGDNTICNELSAVSAGGTLTCNLTSSGTGTYIAQAYRTASPESRIEDLIIQIGNVFATFGKDGMFWTIMLFLTLLLVGIWNPTVSIALGILGVVAISLFGFISIGYAFIIALILMGAIVISQLKT